LGYIPTTEVISDLFAMGDNVKIKGDHEVMVFSERTNTENWCRCYICNKNAHYAKVGLIKYSKIIANM